MTVSSVHTLYAVDIDTSTTDLLVDEITDFTLDPQVTEMIHAADGAVDPRFVANEFVQPTISMSSRRIATILATCGIDGFYFGTGTGLQAYFQALDEGGTRKGLSSHLKLTAAKGLLLPAAIEADMTSAEIQLIAHLLSGNGTADPVVIADDQSLTGTPTLDEVYVVGPATINGVTLDGLKSSSITFGISPTIEGGDGQVYPTFAAIMARAPQIIIRTLDVGILATLGISGVAQDASDSVVYLQKVDAGGNRLAGAGSAISFTIDHGKISSGQSAARQGEPAMTEIRITPVYDGVAAIIAINTNDSIP